MKLPIRLNLSTEILHHNFVLTLVEHIAPLSGQGC
eukprot:XP_001706563.1 Hypothetical protein GL50803_37522 [Giardia lamblia ATCC 50803]